jgi:hypothetical protein
MRIIRTMYDVKPADISGIKTGDIRKSSLMSLQRTVRIRLSDTCIGE